MSNQFFVGQEICCIDDTFKNVTQDQLIREGEVYKIRWIGMFEHYAFGEFLGVKLEGIDRGEDPELGYDDMPFAARRFKPVVPDRLGSLRGLLAGGPLSPAPNEPVRKNVKEDVE
jgi:hypothetical protein